MKQLLMSTSMMLMVPICAHAQTALADLDKDMVGPRTEILVLGSVHLGEYKDFDRASLDPVLDRLAAFKPDYITIEALSGERCDLAARHPAVYGEDFCASTDAAKMATGLDVPSAIVEVNNQLKVWPATPTPAHRRRLAAVFLAAGERASAYVQWLQLPHAEQHPGDGLDESLVEMLHQLGARNNEDYQVAARLAARLGHQRVYPVDDHTGGTHQIPDRAAFGKAVQDAWSADRSRLQPVIDEQKRLVTAKDMLSLYRLTNAPRTQALMAESNVRPALAAVSVQHYPQMWVQGWEIRNLRMVANVLDVVRLHPGSRVLSIVGASHKPWFDGWLGQVSGVDIVDTQAVLSGERAPMAAPDAQRQTR